MLSDLIKSLDQLLKDQTELAGKFERLPKKDPDAIKEDLLKALPVRFSKPTAEGTT